MLLEVICNKISDCLIICLRKMSPTITLSLFHFWWNLGTKNKKRANYQISCSSFCRIQLYTMPIENILLLSSCVKFFHYWAIKYLFFLFIDSNSSIFRSLKQAIRQYILCKIWSSLYYSTSSTFVLSFCSEWDITTF